MKVVSVVVFVVVLLCSFVNADDVILPPFSPSPDDLLQSSLNLFFLFSSPILTFFPVGVVVIHDVGFYDFSYIALIQYFQIQFHNEHISGWVSFSFSFLFFLSLSLFSFFSFFLSFIPP